MTLGPLKRHQPCLGRVERQPVPAEPFRQHVHHLACIGFVGKTNNEVIRVPDQESSTMQTRLHFLLEPHVQHVVQEDVGQERRDHAALRRAFFRGKYSPVFQHARVQPFTNQSQQHTVAYPSLHKLPQVSMIQRVEKLLDVHFQDPSPMRIHLLFP